MFPTPEPEAGIPIVAALTASSRTADKIQGLQATAGRLMSIDERETLTNGLGEIREAYETGSVGDSDSDAD